MSKPKASKAASPAAVVDKSCHIELHRLEGKTDDEVFAAMLTAGMVSNAATVVDYSRNRHSGLSLTDIARSLESSAAAVSAGDLSSLERMLFAQAVALNAMFTEMAHFAAMSLGENLNTSERCMRLAFKAQSQSRATVETLATIKNPPVVYARQANINNGGQQQVNNGAALSSTPARSRGGETTSHPNELLEDCRHGRTQLDARATTAAGRAHQDVEAVGAVNRAAQP
jgi:hypothetical protein